MINGGKKKNEPGFSVLIVDSNPGFLSSSSQLIAESGHRAWGARDLIAAANFLADQTPDLMIVEVDLLELDGADPLADLRGSAPTVPTILMASGPPGERFEAFSKSHEIYGYHDKMHGSVGLLLWVTAADMAARHTDMIRQTRRSMKEILKMLPELHKLEPMDEVLEAILVQFEALMGSKGGFVAARTSDPVGKPPIEGFAHFPNVIDDYVVSAGSDEYPRGVSIDQLGSVPKRLVRRAVEESVHIIDDKHGVLPLALGEHVLGLAYLEQPSAAHHDIDLLNFFATQAAAAIRNAALYELATVDPTTRLYRKSFTLERLRETIKLGWRKSFPITTLLLDINDFKAINGEHGHVTGDRALRYVGTVLKENIRDSDIVGRFGGDGFLVVLIDSDDKGGKIVADRLYKALVGDAARPRPRGVPPLTLSIGMATLIPGKESPFTLGFPNFERLVESLVSEADRAMHAARRDANWYTVGARLTWSDFAQT